MMRFMLNASVESRAREAGRWRNELVKSRVAFVRNG